MSDRVAVAREGGVLSLTLNRPEKRNAMDTPMVDALVAALEQAELDPDVGVVEIRGAGKDFCAGADLAELLASADNTPAQNAAQAARLGHVFVAIRELPKPVVAVVHGRALAGGCGLATASDIVLAHAESSFGYPEIHRGFVPAMVMAMLRRAVGEKVAFDLVATGRVLTAKEAASSGLVSRCIDADHFEETVTAELRSLADASPTALALIKKQLYELDGTTFREAIRLGSEVNSLARSTPDFRDAVSTFLNR